MHSTVQCKHRGPACVTVCSSVMLHKDSNLIQCHINGEINHFIDTSSIVVSFSANIQIKDAFIASV